MASKFKPDLFCYEILSEQDFTLLRSSDIDENNIYDLMFSLNSVNNLFVMYDLD